MKNVRTASLLCFLLCGLPLCAQTVKVNWQTGAPFSTYKTFAWQGPKSQTIPFYGPWVKADVIAELQTKGLTPVAAGQKPDLLVTYHIQGQELVDATSTPDGFGMGAGPWGGGWGWYGGWGGWGPWSDDSTTFTSEHPRTILILTIDMADAAQNKTLVFRGQATVENVSKSESGDEKQTKQCVEKIFRNYPPKPKK
jgi:hypothetical protein